MSLVLPNPVRALSGRRTHALAALWKITRTDGTVFRFTTATATVQFDDGSGVADYAPRGAWRQSAVRREQGLADMECDSEGVVSDAAITYADLEAGLFREAEVREHLVDPRFPWGGAYYSFRYWIEDVEFDGREWRATLVGATSWFSAEVGQTESRTCGADLFDDRCKVLKSAETWFEIPGCRVKAGSQDVDEPRRVFAIVFSDIPNTGPEEDEYKHGRIIWTTGANAGVVSEVKEYAHTATASQRDVELCLPTPYDIADLDEFTIESGCDRLRSTCVRKFDNLANHRGKPFMPGTEAILQTPDGQL